MTSRAPGVRILQLLFALFCCSDCGQGGIVGGDCRNGLSACDGACSNLKTDRDHCGACNHRCPSGQACVNGTCGVAPDSGLTDGGLSDAGLSDGGLSDAGLSDGGLSDGGLSDGGLSDGGLSDGGLSDAATGECSKNEDCPENSICYKLACVCIWPCQPCQVDSDCGIGITCANGYCLTTGPQCFTDADCNSVQACKDGTCINNRSCQFNRDCGSAAVCVSGLCQAGIECLKHAHCAANTYCHSSFECREYVPFGS